MSCGLERVKVYNGSWLAKLKKLKLTMVVDWQTWKVEVGNGSWSADLKELKLIMVVDWQTWKSESC